MEHLSTVTCFLVIARTGDKFWDKPGIDSSDSSRVQRQETWPHWALPGCFGFSTSKPYRPYLIFPVHSFSNLAEFRDRRFTTRNQPDWRSERSESSCSWLVNGLMFDKSLPTGDDSPWLQWQISPYWGWFTMTTVTTVFIKGNGLKLQPKSHLYRWVFLFWVKRELWDIRYIWCQSWLSLYWG